MEGTVTISTKEFLNLLEFKKAVESKNGFMYTDRYGNYVFMPQTEFAKLIEKEQIKYKEEIKNLNIENDGLRKKLNYIEKEALNQKIKEQNKKKGWFGK